MALLFLQPRLLIVWLSNNLCPSVAVYKTDVLANRSYGDCMNNGRVLYSCLSLAISAGAEALDLPGTAQSCLFADVAVVHTQ